MSRATPTVLLVEDNPADVRLAEEVIATGDVRPHLRVAHDGDQALALLRGLPPYGPGALPDLVLLDLNLPRRDGREVLAEIKSDPRLRVVPVVVLTTSAAENDVRLCYELHANAYVTKPADLDRFIEVMRAIERFWLETATLPR